MVSSQEKVNLFIGVIALRIKKNKLEIYILILDYMENHSIAKLGRNFPNDRDNNKVNLWVIHKKCVTEDELKLYSCWLTAEEVERYNSYSRESDRINFVIGRGMARELLAGYVMKHPSDIVFGLTQYGKPYLKGFELNISISHSDDYVSVAVSSLYSIGVDIEYLGDVQKNEKLVGISRSFFSPLEHEQLCALSGYSQKNRFFTLWVLKESYLKALGFGLHTPLHRPIFQFVSSSMFSFNDHLRTSPTCFSVIFAKDIVIGVARCASSMELNVHYGKHQMCHLNIDSIENRYRVSMMDFI